MEDAAASRADEDERRDYLFPMILQPSEGAPHRHVVYLDADGNGVSSYDAGHAHVVMNGLVCFAKGHRHIYLEN